MAQETILFRCSGFGNLMTEGKGQSLTENQAKLLEDFEKRKNGEGKPLTEKQNEEYERLLKIKNAPPQLSETAKRFVEEMWLLNKKGFYDNLDNKYVGKGNFCEDDGIGLVSEVEGNFYIKNTERITKGNLSGECDIFHTYNSFEELPQWRKDIEDGTTKFPLKVIKDIKSSWNPKTFMNGDLSNLYEYQGRCYLSLYNAEEFHLHYTLTDCPPHLFENEIWRLKNRYGIIDIEDEDVKPLFDQLRRNLIFSDNPAYTKEERVKTFVIKRDREIELKMLEKIPMAVEYYHSITLNQK